MVNHTEKDGHSVISISEDELAYLEQLDVSNTSITLHRRNLKLIESEVALLTAAKDTAIKEMETFIKHAHERLEQHKLNLMKLIADQFNELKKSLLDKQNQIEEAVQKLNEDIIQAKNIIKSGDLQRFKTFSENLKAVNEEVQSTYSNLDLGENYLAFDSNKGLDDFNECLCTLGQVYSKGYLPNTISFSSIKAAKAGYETKLTVGVYNHQGNRLPVSFVSVEVLDPTDTLLPIVLCTNSSEFTATFTPQMSGLHTVSGKFLGEKLISEHTHISVGSIIPILKFGEDQDGCEPWGIAIDNDNCLYVADCEKRLIKKFTVDGELLSQFSVDVNDKEHTTVDIALDLNRGLILCTELLLQNGTISEGNTIMEFNLEGVLQHTYTLTDPWKAYHIAINGNGDIMLSTKKEGCLFKVDREGNFISSMGHLKQPGYIAINKDGTIIVPDTGDGCIYIFNPDGTIRQKFGSSGTGKGQLDQPRGVATDGEYILVSEWNNNRIQVFKYDGTLVSMIESLEDPLDDPIGLAVTADGHVYVADNNCIKKYKYRNVSWWQLHHIGFWYTEIRGPFTNID